MAKKKTNQKQILIQKKKKVPIEVITVRQVAEKLLQIFKQHIGEGKRISQVDLFYKIYGVSKHEINDLKSWFMWDIIRKACHYCRKYTRCKIISKIISKGYKLTTTDKYEGFRYYFVASTVAEAEVYCNTLKKSQLAMERAKKRMRSAIKNNYHKNTDKWTIQ